MSPPALRATAVGLEALEAVDPPKLPQPLVASRSRNPPTTEALDQFTTHSPLREKAPRPTPIPRARRYRLCPYFRLLLCLSWKNEIKPTLRSCPLRRTASLTSGQVNRRRRDAV